VNESGAPWIDPFRDARSFLISGRPRIMPCEIKLLRPERSAGIDRRYSLFLPHKCNANSFADPPGDSYVCA